MTFQLGDLDRSTLESLRRNFSFDEDKPSYEKAFYRHKKCAEVLYEATLFRESYLTYLLALECLLKDIYYLTSAMIFGPDPIKSQAAILVTSKRDGKNKTSLSDHVNAQKFSHSLAVLLQTIKDLFPELDKQDPPRFNALVVATDAKLDWARERYQDPAARTEDWSEKCQKFQKALAAFLTEDLKGLYGEDLQ